MTNEQRKLFNEHFPARGACGFCGFHDANHRILDAIVERHKAGDTIEGLSWDYEMPMRAIQLVVDTRPYQDEEE